MFERVLKFISWILLGVFFNNCTREIYRVMYGPPSFNYYNIKIKTVSKKFEEIPDLKVSVYNEENFVLLTNNFIEGNIINLSNNNSIKVFMGKYTLSNGVVELNFYDYNNSRYFVVIEDIDGITNFGDFQTTNIMLVNNIDIVNVIMEEKK